MKAGGHSGFVAAPPTDDFTLREMQARIRPSCRAELITQARRPPLRSIQCNKQRRQDF
jgi:hypothetical protein